VDTGGRDRSDRGGKRKRSWQMNMFVFVFRSINFFSCAAGKSIIFQCITFCVSSN
jgi:hypothetical protein